MATLDDDSAEELPAPRKTRPRIIINLLLYLMKLVIFCINIFIYILILPTSALKNSSSSFLEAVFFKKRIFVSSISLK